MIRKLSPDASADLSRLRGVSGGCVKYCGSAVFEVILEVESAFLTE